MKTPELLAYLSELLQPELINDYCPNGLQVEGKADIQRIVTGVTACQALIDAAIAEQADALLVHHGYFWKGEAYPVVGMKRKRLKALLDSGINLLAYHLPLDVHPKLGNNAQLARLLEINNLAGLESGNPYSIPMYGELSQPLRGNELAQRIQQQLGRTPLWIQGKTSPLKRIGLCTGGGQSYIELAAEQGCDAFISGEASEQTVHLARELGIDFYAAGHHATERYGVKSLGEHLAQQLSLDVTFVDIDNPV